MTLLNNAKYDEKITKIQSTGTGPQPFRTRKLSQLNNGQYNTTYDVIHQKDSLDGNDAVTSGHWG